MTNWQKTMDLRWLQSPSWMYGEKDTLQQRQYRGRKVAHEYPAPDGEYHISGRGDVYTYTDQEQPSVGELVLIDGHCYEVRGIETHAVLGREKSRKFGLLIKLAEPDYEERWVDVPMASKD